MKKLVKIIIIMLFAIITFENNVRAEANIATPIQNIKKGEQVIITVSFGEKVAIAQFKLDYNEEQFEYIENSKGNPFTSESKQFGYISSDGITADLEEISFTFKAKKSGTSKFTISDLKVSTASEKKIELHIENNTVEIRVETEQEEKDKNIHDKNKNENSENETDNKTDNKKEDLSNSRENENNTNIQENTNLLTTIAKTDDEIEIDTELQKDVNEFEELKIKDVIVKKENYSIMLIIIIAILILVIAIIVIIKKVNHK